MADATTQDKRTRRGPETVAGTQPSVRTFTLWTPSLIRAAEMQADRGDLRGAANLFDYILGDDRAGTLLHGRAQSLLGLLPTFEPTGDRRRSNVAVKALDAQEDYWTSYPETELTLMVVWGLGIGLAPFRHRWLKDPKTKRVLPCPEFWHPQHFRQDPSGQWFARVDLSGSGFGSEEQAVTPGDSEWILHQPFGTHRPWTMAYWRGLGRLCLLKSLAIGDWARHSEKAALLVATNTPKNIGETVTEAASKEQRQELAQQLYDRGRDGVAVLPPFFDIKLVETIANTKAIYDAQIEMANDAIAIAIRGGNLSTDAGEGGSFAAAKSQAKTGDSARLKFDAQALTTTLHDQSLVWWANFNFGDPFLAPWPVYPVVEQEDIKAVAEAWRSMGFAVDKFLRLGFVLDDDGTALLSKYGMNGLFKIGPKGLTATQEVLPEPALPKPDT